MKKILIITDAWKPQTNGVVTTLGNLINNLEQLDFKVKVISPQDFKTINCPGYNNIDISLDTFPFAGATTTFESLWMGVPTITLSGEIFNSKFGLSINKNLNLDTFIAKDKNDYIEKAKIISSDINKLSQIRYSLRNLAINSSLFDNKDFGLELCKILKDKWRLFSQQNKNL